MAQYEDNMICGICGKENENKYQDFCIDLGCSGRMISLKDKKEPVAESPLQYGVIKPPLGLKPKKINEEQRYVEVQTAIDRYCIDGLKIPVEWVEEYNELLDKMAS